MRRIYVTLVATATMFSYSEEAHVARHAVRVNQSCMIKGEAAKSAARFLEFGASESNKIDIFVHDGLGEPRMNYANWDSKAASLTIGDIWEDWSTGTSSQVEGPKLSFQLHAPSMQLKRSDFWRMLTAKLKVSRADKFNAEINSSMKVLGTKKFSEENQFLTLALYSIDQKDAARFGADSDCLLVLISCGRWIVGR